MLERTADLPRGDSPQRQIQMAGFSGSMEFALMDVTLQSRSAMDALKTVKSAAVNDFTKSIPKGGAKILRGICSLMLPDMSDVSGAECPKEHFKRFSASALLKYDKLGWRMDRLISC
ncbi:hypothetical protein [Candidatus Neptunichlamydia sp. REUL1]|uniref:hypothetical protein n=1 Tax=Candidatus Neptunichlamydia sp. REUL1 TaxID=3064277 RepID=UPI00292CBC53|nr:hypothetical protein [Candidatus Neptunochlamydia sp. REUL1]